MVIAGLRSRGEQREGREERRGPGTIPPVFPLGGLAAYASGYHNVRGEVEVNVPKSIYVIQPATSVIWKAGCMWLPLICTTTLGGVVLTEIYVTATSTLQPLARESPATRIRDYL
jgi:hypothetical protein